MSKRSAPEMIPADELEFMREIIAACKALGYSDRMTRGVTSYIRCAGIRTREQFIQQPLGRLMKMGQDKTQGVIRRLILWTILPPVNGEKKEG